MSIRPGLSVRIVTDIDETKERILVKGSTVQTTGAVIILAQTDPPILKSKLHKEAIVTYLINQKDGAVRHGFTAELVEFIDYSLNSGQQVKALVVEGQAPKSLTASECPTAWTRPAGAISPCPFSRTA